MISKYDSKIWYNTHMVDRLGKRVYKGDAVKYWHKVDGKPVPEIGEVIAFNHVRKEFVIERKRYNDTNESIRTKSGITKLTKAEAELKADDGNGNILFVNTYKYTDFPLDEIKMYVVSAEDFGEGAMMLMLPSEY